MSRRWYLWAIVLFALSLIALFPLRLALEAAMDEDSVLTARAVGGPVWGGRIGEAALGPQRIGTFEVALAPLPLLIGRTEVRVERLDDPDGPLAGRFFLSGPSEGVASVNGRVAIDALAAPLPIEAIEFDDVDALFDDDGCARGSGTVTALPSSAVPFVTSGLTGPVTCGEDGRLTIILEGPRGGERLELRLAANGTFENALIIASPPEAIAEILRGAGFVPDGTDYVLSGSGQLR